MKFDDRFIDELKSRLRLSDVIGRTVVLKRQGREYRGLSPFTKERTPSFYVNDEKGFFHDFSSGKHGDLIGFLQETERLSFREAVERLAAEAGVPLPAPDPRSQALEQRRLGLQDWLEEAAKWFETQLRRPQGEGARAYLDRRGLTPEDWTRFRLGLAPNGRTGLKDHLIAKGAAPDDLVEAGLLVAPEDGGAPFDRFRDRVIFPITDTRGRVVSFGGRALSADARAKYLNGPESPLFHKGQTLYGLPEARKLLHLADSGGGDGTGAAGLVVVEGYMDAIACQRAGVPAVAPLGTALTEAQIELLWRMHDEPTLCFDGDAAGRRAAHRSLDRALPMLKPGRSLRFAFPVGGKDPDDVLREQGAAVLRAQLADTQPFVAVLFERERLEAGELSTPERRTALKAQLRKAAGTIVDKDLSAAYRQDLLQRYEALWTLERPARTYDEASRVFRGGRDRKFKRDPLAPQRNDTTPQGAAEARRLHASPDILAAAIAQAVLDHPDLVDDAIDRLETRGFDDERLSSLAREIVHERLTVDALDSATLRDHLQRLGHGETLQAIARASARLNAPFLKPDLPFEELRALWSQAFDTLIRITALERAIVDAKDDIEKDEDYSALFRLKTERDLERRAVRDGTAWAQQGSTLDAIIH
ncbi:DNA primase [soil metagenome]